MWLGSGRRRESFKQEITFIPNNKFYILEQEHCVDLRSRMDMVNKLHCTRLHL